MPQMNVGDRVRCIDNRLSEYFKVGEVYTIKTSDLLWPDGFYYTNEKGERVQGHKDTKKFTFVEVPGYVWTCSFLFEDA